jgi:hypothetical protein
LLAGGAALLRRAAPDIALDLVKLGDALVRLRGNRRGSRLGQFVEAATDMRSTEGRLVDFRRELTRD